MANSAQIIGLYRYPLKSARGQPLTEARLTATGLEGDRHWLLVTPQGKFITQRETPQLALLRTDLDGDTLCVSATDLPEMRIAAQDANEPCQVEIWRDVCAAFAASSNVSRTLSQWLKRECRLVRFNAAHERRCNPLWTGATKAITAFADGYPMLLVNNASLADLNRRLGVKLPVNRFRPNLVIDGLEPYAEDHLGELQLGDIVLRIVKPCERCVVTTTDQATGLRDGGEPLRTLRGYRYDAALHGVTFGHNAIAVAGIGKMLRQGAPLTLRWRQ